jgi:hypothetical protein
MENEKKRIDRSYKVFTFYGYGDGENPGDYLFKCEGTQGDEMLADLYLFGKTKPSSAAEYTAKAALEAFMSAETAGHPVVELPENMRTMTVEKVLKLLREVSVEVTFVTPEEQGADTEGDGSDAANPTDTPADAS